jgi:hypothetical protein
MGIQYIISCHYCKHTSLYTSEEREESVIIRELHYTTTDGLLQQQLSQRHNTTTHNSGIRSAIDWFLGKIGLKFFVMMFGYFPFFSRIR